MWGEKVKYYLRDMLPLRMKMATGCTTTAPYVTNSPVKAIRARSAKNKFSRNAFRAIKVLAEIAIFTCMTANLSPKALANNAEDSFRKGKPPVVLQLENKALGEGKTDSLKNEVKKIDVSDGIFITAPKGANIISVKKDDIKDAKTSIFTYMMHLDGIQIITADAYSSQKTIVRDFVNGQLVNQHFSFGPTESHSAYVNGTNVFPQSFNYIFRSNDVVYPQIAWVKMKYFYITDLPPIYENNLQQISPLIWAFLSNYGETPSTLSYAIDAPIPPRTLGATKVLIISISDYDGNFVKLNVRGNVAIVKTIDEEDVVAPGNAPRTVWGISTITRIFNVNGNNYNDSCRGANLGNYILNGYAPEPNHPSMIATSVIIGITPGATTIPTKFALYQNIPNPFNAQTNIEYDVPKKAHVYLGVYDVLGRKVSNLVDGEKLPGAYHQIFNADNLPTGIYFYRMNAGEFTETKKMALVK